MFYVVLYLATSMLYIKQDGIQNGDTKESYLLLDDQVQRVGEQGENMPTLLLSS